MLAKKIRKFPPVPGIYVFRAKNGKALYVGKAGNLKARLSFYFRIKARLQPRTAKLLDETAGLQIIKTDSGIEALVKEAEVIKRLRPKYNILMRDDKNYLFVVITKEDFPRIVLTHQPKTFTERTKTLGPFTDAGAIKATLKLLRRTFPYCTCKNYHKRLCLNAELGKCPGFCCRKSKSQITNHPEGIVPRTIAYGELRGRSRHCGAGKLQTEYKKNIKTVIAILEGKKISALMQEIKKRMTAASRAMNYESASRLRDQLFGLRQILLHRPVIKRHTVEASDVWAGLEKKLRLLLKTEKRIIRVEGYDISNISGGEAAGAMVVFINGAPDKNEYRKFKIKTVRGANDVLMMAEVIMRRFNHNEWPFPDCIVLDGGKPQLSAALAALAELRGRLAFGEAAEQRGKFMRQPASAPHGPAPVVTALAKRDEELYVAGRKKPIQLKKGPREVLHFFQRVRDEAHRFSRKYHHALRKKKYYEPR